MAVFTQLFKSGILFLIYVICFAIVIRVITETFSGDSDGSGVGGISGFCRAISEPFAAPVRVLLDKLNVPEMSIDLSLYVTCFVLVIIADLLETLVP